MIFYIVKSILKKGRSWHMTIDHKDWFCSDRFVKAYVLLWRLSSRCVYFGIYDFSEAAIRRYSTEKVLPRCAFNKVALQLYWNHTSALVFSCKFVEYFQNTLSWEHHWMAASDFFSVQPTFWAPKSCIIKKF